MSIILSEDKARRVMAGEITRIYVPNKPGQTIWHVIIGEGWGGVVNEKGKYVYEVGKPTPLRYGREKALGRVMITDLALGDVFKVHDFSLGNAGFGSVVEFYEDWMQTYYPWLLRLEWLQALRANPDYEEVLRVTMEKSQHSKRFSCWGMNVVVVE